MTVGFTFLVSPHFERLAKRLSKQQPEFIKQFQKVVAILHVDLYIQSQKHLI